MLADAWRRGITGKDLHEQHHNTPYFHICVDGVELVAPVMLLALAAFSAAFHGAPALGHTAALSYWAAGLAYLWTHYFVHLPVDTGSRWAKAVRRHHMLCVPLQRLACAACDYPTIYCSAGDVFTCSAQRVCVAVACLVRR